MKLLSVLFIFLSFTTLAQPPAEKKPVFKIDTVKLQPTLEKSLIENFQKIQQHKSQIAELEKLNAKWYKVIVETGKIDTARIAEQPAYIPGKMIFKLKPK